MSSAIATVRKNGFGEWTVEYYGFHYSPAVCFLRRDVALEFAAQRPATLLEPDAFDAEVARRDAEAEARRLTPPLL